MFKVVQIILVLFLISFQADTFKSDQLRYSRVRHAYKDKESVVLNELNKLSLHVNKLELYIRAFKQEKELELWGKNKSDESFQLIKTFNICTTVGKSGPKRRQGDMQIPEGFYHINIYNPYSNFYLSLGINYPNKSDKILGVKNNLGGDIYIHGSCVTIGCIPITDDNIKELYVYCVEAKNSGQNKIPVSIFPARLSEEKLKTLKSKYLDDIDKCNLWDDLYAGYTSFNHTKRLPNIRFLNSGRHEVK